MPVRSLPVAIAVSSTMRRSRATLTRGQSTTFAGYTVTFTGTAEGAPEPHRQHDRPVWQAKDGASQS
jgi:hypothetical protein